MPLPIQYTATHLIIEGVMILKSVGHNCVKFVETFLNWKNDMMSSRLTFADHDQTIEGGGRDTTMERAVCLQM